MKRFAQDVYLASGLRTPFARGGGALAGYDAIGLSVPVAQAMAQQLGDRSPDLMVWGTVIPSLSWSNIAREVWLDAGLDASVPSFSTIMACGSSMVGAIAAAGMLGGGVDVALVGGAETMSRPPIGLTAAAGDRLRALFATSPADALAALGSLKPTDFALPIKGWANRITGRTMGEHMEDTAKQWSVSREAQDAWALRTHQRAVRGWEAGFFDDLVVPLPEIARDNIPRTDTSAEKLASLPVVFDKTSGRGTLTAGNSSPITDGAAGVWVLTDRGRSRLPASVPAVKLVDFELAAVDYKEDGLLMAPSFAIPRLLHRHRLSYGDVALWEIHEAFAAQVLANVAALENPGWIEERVGIREPFGAFPWDRVNPNGSSVAIGHPFGATGARDLSQAVKELAAMPNGSRAIVSICTDGGEGAVTLLENA